MYSKDDIMYLIDGIDDSQARAVLHEMNENDATLRCALGKILYNDCKYFEYFDQNRRN